jgi:glycosyltransferase involved in cell wall biosynthesis
MNKSPKVSICIPTYNQTKYLSKTLDSILVQGYKNYEIIITDDTKTKLIESLVNQYNFEGKLKYYKNSVRLGSPKNWNQAISYATGDYIKIIHHDDWLTNANSLEEYVNLLDQNPTCDFAFSSSHVVFENVKEWIHSISEEQIAKIRKQPAYLFNGNLIGAPSATIFRNHKNILFDPNLKWLVDLDFYIRMLQQNSFLVYCKKPLVVTFAAQGRVTDLCLENKEIEIFEYFYVFHKLTKNVTFFKSIRLQASFLYLITICQKYDIRNIKEINACGYNGKIHWLIKIYFLCKHNLLFERIFIKLLSWL